MSTHPKRDAALLAALLAVAAVSAPSALAQQQGPRGPWQDPGKAIQVTVAPGVPLSIASKDTAGTDVQVRGALMVIDLECRLMARNESGQFLRGVTFAIVADPLATGGKASVALPSLNVAPDSTFPVHLSFRLLRPLPASPSDVIDVSVDGVLLADLTFFGPNQFNSRRRMMVWEMEAERDRRFFKSLLDSEGPERLEQAIRASLERQSRRPRLHAQRTRTRSAAAEVHAPEREIKLAPVDLPESPLEVVSGKALVEGGAAQAPQVKVKNRSRKPVRYFELGWLITDRSGVRYAAGTVPAPNEGVRLPPGGVTSAEPRTEFLFQPRSESPRETAFVIAGMSGYISHVQFEDGGVWIPSRTSLERSELIDTAPVSVEEQRLTAIYVRKGLQGLIDELAQF